MAKTQASFGRWPSPITVDLLTGSSISIADIKADGKNDLYFLESRPYEKGRSVLVKMDGDGKATDVVNDTANVRTRVHGYGGFGYTIGKQGIVWSEFSDNKLRYAKNKDKPLETEYITPADKPLRFGNFQFHPSKPLLIAVCEDHTKPDPADVQT